MTQYIKPDPNCKACRGTGFVGDWVPMPFGSGSCRMDTFCSCVEEQANDEDEIEIVGQDEKALFKPAKERGRKG